MARNKIIFLDIDGVVHPLNSKHLPALVNYQDLLRRTEEEDARDTIEVLPGEFCPQQMTYLKSILTATQAKLVLSSTWRETDRGREAVHLQLAKHGISSALVIGCTPCLYQQWTCRRAHEIVQWLKNNSSTVSNFVILDDSDLMYEGCSWKREMDESKETDALGGTAAAHFIRQYFVRMEKTVALTEENALAAIQLLNRETVLWHKQSDFEAAMEAVAVAAAAVAANDDSDDDDDRVDQDKEDGGAVQEEKTTEMKQDDIVPPLVGVLPMARPIRQPTTTHATAATAATAAPKRLHTAYHITDCLPQEFLERLDKLRPTIPVDLSRPTCPRRFLSEWEGNPGDPQRHREDGWVSAGINKAIQSWFRFLPEKLETMPWFRFLEYPEKHPGMPKHTDGSNKHPYTSDQSVATMLIYLSDSSGSKGVEGVEGKQVEQEDVGGGTTLYVKHQVSKKERRQGVVRRDLVLESIPCVRNSAIIFPHQWLHAGDAVGMHPKIALRCELLFKRTLAGAVQVQ